MRILITGANGAMAKETIKHLIKDRYLNITMAVRTQDKGENAKNEILKALNYPYNVKLNVVEGFDMNEPEKIKAAIANLSKEVSFDIVFLAAGFAVFGDDYQSVKYNGKTYEKTIFQNLIGSHFVFNELKKYKLLSKNARIVIAGGEGARGIKGMIEKPSFANAKDFKNYIHLTSKSLPKYNPMNAIGVSKFVGALWVKKLAELESEKYTLLWFSPGLTSGSAGLKNLSLSKRIIFGLMFRIMNLLGKSQTPEKGGRKFADALTGKVGNHGELIGALEGKTLGKYTEQTHLNPLMVDALLKEELWNILQSLDN